MVIDSKEFFVMTLRKARRILLSRPSKIVRNRTQSDLNSLAVWFTRYLVEEAKANEKEKQDKCQ